jgi:hypothetical protein
MDASEYIKELKQKVARLNQEIACAQNALRQTSSDPTVYTNERRFLICFVVALVKVVTVYQRFTHADQLICEVRVHQFSHQCRTACSSINSHASVKALLLSCALHYILTKI